MTETKRFLIDDAGELIDLKNHKFIDYGDECCKLLNELSDENEQLRKENDMLSCELSVSANKEISRNCRITELEEENEQLKQQKDKWKQQCIHFKEMLDDMDITYLCDEWIYEELKGDVE